MSIERIVQRLNAIETPDSAVRELRDIVLELVTLGRGEAVDDKKPPTAKAPTTSAAASATDKAPALEAE
jgi:hypothetical protein